MMLRYLNYIFNFDVLKNQRQGWVDIVKGFAIILVVYRHILIGIERSDIYIHPIYMKANEMVYSFRMPLFFLLSGFFFAKSLGKRGIGAFTYQKIRTLLYPYLIWSCILISIQIAFKGIINADRNLIDYLYILLRPRAIDQMWFLFALFNVTLIYAFIKQKLVRSNLLLFIIGVLLHGISSMEIELGPLYDICYYFIFFFLGDYFSQYFLDSFFRAKFRSFKVSLVFLPLFAFSQWYWLTTSEINVYLFTVVSLIGAYFSINLSMLVEGTRLAEFFRWVGVHSLPVYILHPSIGAIIRIIMIKVGVVDGPVILLFGILVSTIISIAFFNITRNMGIGFLFSFERPLFRVPGKFRTGQ